MAAETPVVQQVILDGRTTLGIELGSTRIKAVLIGEDHAPLAVGSYSWENEFVDRRWTYSLESVWTGVGDCYASLAADVRQRYGVELSRVSGLGVSAMMHGYLAFDVAGELLAPFRTWRNTNTGAAVDKLSKLFGYNIRTGGASPTCIRLSWTTRTTSTRSRTSPPWPATCTGN